MLINNSSYGKLIILSLVFLISSVCILSTDSYATNITTGAGTVIDTIVDVTTGAGTVIDMVSDDVMDEQAEEVVEVILTTSADIEEAVDDVSEDLPDANTDANEPLEDTTENSILVETSELYVDEALIIDEETDALETDQDDELLELKESDILPTDVNKSGEYTLLDLGIDARHYSKNPNSSELSNYNTDVIINNKIDDDDLESIAERMMDNSNYGF